MNKYGIDIDIDKWATLVAGALLFVVCPFLFPKLGEQQNSYVQILFFSVVLCCGLVYKVWYPKLGWLTFRLLDASIVCGVVLLMIHLFVIKPVSLSVWWWLDLINILGLYWFVRLHEKRDFKLLMALFVVGGMCQCSYACIQQIELCSSLHSAFPMTGSFMNPAPFAGYLSALGSVLVAAFCYSTPKSLKAYSYLSIVVLFAIVMFALNSRTAWLSFLFVGVIIVYDCYLSGKNWRCRFLFTICLLMGFIFLLYYLYYLREVSANGRLFIWRNTLEMIRDNTLSGVGIENFKSSFPYYQAKYYAHYSGGIEKYYDGNTFFVFNDFLRLEAELGCVLGILVLTPLFIVLCKSRKKSVADAIPLYGIINLLIFSCFSYPLSIFTLQVLFIFMIASMGHCSISLFRWRYCSYIKYAVSCSVVLLCCTSIKGIQVISNWRQIMGKPQLNMKEVYCDKDYCYFQDNLLYTLSYYKALRKHNNKEKALELLNNALKRIPVAGLYLLRAELYMEMKEGTKAEQDLRFVIRLSPTLLEPVYRLAQLYVMTNRQSEALFLLEDKLSAPLYKRDLSSRSILFDMHQLYEQLKKGITPSVALP